MSEEELIKKALWVRRETLKLHKRSPETRVASSLSDVEIFVALYYGGVLAFDPKNPGSEERDRFIISKGHGAVSMYPILADLGFFDVQELKNIGSKDSFLGAIPDPLVPGFETVNGSLGHGLGVASGIALALKRKGSKRKVYVLLGDGELNSGAVWEAVIFTAFHKLNNLTLIIDNNKISMLGYQKDILGIEPYEKKFDAFNWRTSVVDGHAMGELLRALKELNETEDERPSVLIANTIKGKGVARLEGHPLSHILSLSADEVDTLLEEMK